MSSRRTFVGIVLALPIAPGALAATARDRRLDPRDSADLATIIRKMRFRMDDGLIFNWLSGTKYGQVGSTLVPLMNMEVGGISRIRNVADGFDVTSLERTFYTDIDTGRPLTRWRNPYTGEDIDIARGPVGPTTVRYLNTGDRVLPDTVGGAKFSGSSITRLVSAVDDDVWIANDAHVRLTRGASAGTFEVHEWSTSHARLTELSDRRVMSVRAEIYLQEITSWALWMKMGDRPGTVTSRGVGRKVLAYGEMPGSWRSLMETSHPDIARDPQAALDRQANRFEQ